MNRLKKFLPLHFVLLLILGIFVQYQTSFWQYGFFQIFVLYAIFALSFLGIKNRKVITFSVLLCFFFTGVFTVFLNNDRNYENYYEKHLKDEIGVVLKVNKILKPSNYYFKYEVEVSRIGTAKTRGTILLNIKKDSSLVGLQVDEQIYAEPVFKEITAPLNPYQFNYKKYLEKQGVYNQVFLDKLQFIRVETKAFSLFGLSAKIRITIQESLKKHSFKENELAVISALLLGQRQDISKDLIADYSNAGVIHILAVSGLHVGVFLLILSFLFKPLERVKNGKFLKTFFIVLLLWSFAFIAGLSASVVRAVTMFTFVAVGLAFKQRSVVEFSLVSSMFFLLLIKPMFLFDVGFQLSYLAVFGIVWLQPKLQKTWKPPNKIFNFFWQLFTVSIAAQISVLPLSIYYFQQFPGLFMLSNFVIIPCLMSILIGGILIIVLSLLKILPPIIVDIYGFVISVMNRFVGWVSHQETFIFKEISISFLMLICWYVLIVFGVRFLIYKTPKRLIFFFACLFILQNIFLLEWRDKNQAKELIVFHKTKHSIIAKRAGDKLVVQHDLDSLKFRDDCVIKPFRVSQDISTIHQTNFNNLLQFSDKKMLLVDSLGVYPIGLENPIVLLQYSPKINLSRMIKKVNPSQIIADGSNYKSYKVRWKNICDTESIPFYDTSKKGAFVLKY